MVQSCYYLANVLSSGGSFIQNTETLSDIGLKAKRLFFQSPKTCMFLLNNVESV